MSAGKNESSGEDIKPGDQDLQNASLERDADFLQAASEGAQPAVEPNDELSRLRQENQRLQTEISQQRESFLRAMADLENYKKRALKERSELLRYQGEKILFDLISVLDAVELAVQHKDADPAQLKSGVELIYKLFVDTLGKWEVRAVEAMGQVFDPNRFQAIGKVAAEGATPGTIIQVARKAYFYRDKLLRPGEAVVASAVAESAPDTDLSKAEV